LAWFVYQDSPGWQQYSIEAWKSLGNPVGHAGDLSTALSQSSSYRAGLPGSRSYADYNSDGVVDLADYAEWRSEFGLTRFQYADGNRNLRVDAADYVLWRKLATASTGNLHSQNAPEPAGTTLALLAIVLSLANVNPRPQLIPRSCPYFE
jgi:hypothetical protein